MARSKPRAYHGRIVITATVLSGLATLAWWRRNALLAMLVKHQQRHERPVDQPGV